MWTEKQIENAAICAAYAMMKLTWSELTPANQAWFRYVAKEALDGAERVKESIPVTE